MEQFSILSAKFDCPVTHQNFSLSATVHDCETSLYNLLHNIIICSQEEISRAGRAINESEQMCIKTAVNTVTLSLRSAQRKYQTKVLAELAGPKARSILHKNQS